jgi:hypothetical protein
MNSLKEVLDKLILKMGDYPLLNHGGCCVFASEVAHLLYEKGYCVFIRVYDDETNENLNTVRKNKNTLLTKPSKLKEYMNKNKIYFGHVLLEVELNGERVLFDSEGYYGFDEVEERIYNDGSKIVKGRLTLEEARKIADSKDGWNKKFDRNLIPDIKQNINTILENLLEL